MNLKLTKKQKGFVKDYVEIGIGEIAALKNYDIQSENKGNVARSIASENLTKPNIVKTIAEMLPDDLLAERHLELLNKREYVKKGKNIIDTPDTQAVGKGLEMAYKLKGYNAPEKSEVKTLNVNIDSKTIEIAKKFEKELNKSEDETGTSLNKGVGAVKPDKE